MSGLERGAVCEWGILDHGQLQRVSAIGVPVFVANGDGDPMILPHFSHLLAGLIPQAQVKICPDAAHGFLFQHHAEFARDVDAFLRACRSLLRTSIVASRAWGPRGPGLQHLLGMRQETR